MVEYLDYKRLTLLVVDDDKSLLKFFKIHLGSQFSSVIVLNKPEDIQPVINSHTVDLVLTDYEMPQMNGLDVCELIKSHSSYIPVVLVTGAELDAPFEDEIKSAVDGFLRKPFDISELSEVLAHCVAMRRQYLKSAHNNLVKLSLRNKQKRKLLLAADLLNHTPPKKVVGGGS